MKLKRILFFAGLFFSIMTVFSQNKGSVLYKVVSNNKKINSYKSKKLEAFFKATASFELLFKEDKSIYKLKPNFDKNGERKKINFFEIVGGGDGVFYSEKGKVIESVNKYDELFLIEYPHIEWDITQEKKKIGNYICYKAISKDKTVAWFTPQVPLNLGPNKYNGLPGLILEVEIGKISIRALKINFKKLQDIDIQKPTKGKKITEKEYLSKLKKIAKEIGF
ncbi:GLPGLI family protein [uncultured Tenacibaculum sp.]|uniref:GLPGLI family protein n=1 Tax=uncultured Tenacibaculum sp. TaxID=174713 RepID=UPI002604176F|nr:GLPGLI family protein [uncultured Tenacibaculum sp.]